MRTENIIVRKLIPSDGKYLTNGTVYSDCVYLGAEEDPANWVEVDEAVALAAIEKQNKEAPL
jgi:hypothetical protein